MKKEKNNSSTTIYSRERERERDEMSKCGREKVGEMNVVEGGRERSDIFQVSCSLHTIFITWFCGILLNNKRRLN
jgi:hypothetical protein